MGTSIKSVLVPIDGGPASFAALDQAFVVADRFGAHIKALHVMQGLSNGAPVGLFNVSADLRRNVKEQVETAVLGRASELKEQFEALCGQRGIAIGEQPAEDSGGTASWHAEWGRANDVIVNHGRVADVIVVRRPMMAKNAVWHTRLGENLESILLSTARPVLLVPPESEAKQCAKIAIGWNESAEASRALAMTLPWLAAMGAVTVMVSKKRQPRVSRLVDYLAWHGIRSDVELLDGRGESVGEGMLNICAETGAELLVVGGFSQGSTRHLFFGGVTGYLLSNSNVLTVMVH